MIYHLDVGSWHLAQDLLQNCGSCFFILGRCNLEWGGKEADPVFEDGVSNRFWGLISKAGQLGESGVSISHAQDEGVTIVI
jgi:hypothetical protein